MSPHCTAHHSRPKHRTPGAGAGLFAGMIRMWVRMWVRMCVLACLLIWAQPAGATPGRPARSEPMRVNTPRPMETVARPRPALSPEVAARLRQPMVQEKVMRGQFPSSTLDQRPGRPGKVQSGTPVVTMRVRVETSVAAFDATCPYPTLTGDVVEGIAVDLLSSGLLIDAMEAHGEGGSLADGWVPKGAVAGWDAAGAVPDWAVPAGSAGSAGSAISAGSGGSAAWTAGAGLGAFDPSVAVVVAAEPAQTRAEGYVREARRELLEGSMERALVAYADAVNRDAGGDPERFDVRRERALALLCAGECAEASRVMREAYEEEPALASTPMDLSWDARGRVLRDAARRAARGAAAEGTASAWMTLAVVTHAQGRTSAAVRLLDRAEAQGLDGEVLAALREAMQR